MALKGQMTIDEINLIEVSSDPSASPGIAAPDGSIAVVDSGGVWQKKAGSGNTGWVRIDNVDAAFIAVTYSGAFVAKITAWTSSGMTQKVSERVFTRTGSLVTQIVENYFDSSASIILTITSVLAYTNSKLQSTTVTYT